MEKRITDPNQGTGCLGTFLIVSLIVIILTILGIFTYFYYNGMVQREEQVMAQWAQVENHYQRRADLIENLVNVVKGYAEHEKTTLTQVIEARAKATAVTINADNMNEEMLNKFQQAQDGLNSALARLMVVYEQYPDLKANQGFLKLQDQLKETEDLIAKERKTFNETAQTYNTYIRKFPRNIVASMFGFKKKPYFQAELGSNVAPKIQ